MPEVVNAAGLIEMNAHMIRTDLAIGLMLAGGMGLALVLICNLINLAIGDKKHIMTGLGWSVPFVIVLAALLVTGLRMPMKKQIMACAAGQVSIEQIAARYDVVGVDGKMLTLIER